MATRTCRICGQAGPPLPHIDGRCPRCMRYRYQHGREWEPRRPAAPGPGQTCGHPTLRPIRGRCPPYYRYWHRTGRERPPERWQHG